MGTPPSPRTSSSLPPLRWQRAAMLGSLWAANEIVLGSFLHNVGIPFTGTLLASIGVMLLVAGLRLWDDPGVIWRAGVICSLMKSISPSAVILGPMIGILAEAGIVYVFVLLFRRSLAGCLLGGMIASVTPILQKILSILVAYGMDAARMYASLFTLLSQRLGFTDVDAEGALWILAGAQTIPGALAVLAGVAVARRARAMPPQQSQPSSDETALHALHSTAQPHSLAALIFHIIFIVAGLTLIPFLPQLLTPVPVAVYLLGVLFWYPGLRKKFARVRLWVEFAAVALLAGLLLGTLAPGGMGTWWTGLLSGVVMAARATLVVAAFSAISIELRNPVVVNWFLQRGLGTVSDALQVAFRALPAMIQSLGRQRNGLRHPLRAFSTMLAFMLAQLDDLSRIPMRASIVLLTGAQGVGKTTLLTRAIAHMRKNGLSVGGILSHVRHSDSVRIGYDIENILTGEHTTLCRADHGVTGKVVGSFVFDDEGLTLGAKALAWDSVRECSVVIVDEVGPLEMQGGGWAEAAQQLFRIEEKKIVLVVRPGLVNDIQAAWGFVPERVWDMKSLDEEEFLQEVVR